MVVAKQSEISILQQASDRLGMSPVARARLEVGDDHDGGKFDGLLGGHALRLVQPDDPA